MKAVISSTYDDKYLYFLPIVTWCWNKLGVDVICFMPEYGNKNDVDKMELIFDVRDKTGLKFVCPIFKAPEHKEATYAQCSRLYGACLDLPMDEVLIIGDVDMAMFKVPQHENGITIFGSDLVPEGQFPMCYASGTVGEWRSSLKLEYGGLSANPKNSLMVVYVSTYQECLDALLGDIECEHMRGNYWGKDQQTLWEKTKDEAILIPRARQGTQFASNRYDRDDSYILDRLNPDTIDFHMNRPGYEDKNFEIILTILKYHYPNEDFDWLIEYTKQYKALL